jgi:hypothetical protein
MLRVTTGAGLRDILLPAALCLALAACGGDDSSGAAPPVTVAPTPTPPPTGGAQGQTQIGQWRELILNNDGTINQAEYRRVAANYNSEEMVSYRNGPRATDFQTPMATETVYQPDPNGLLGVNATNRCVTSDRLPRSEAEERQRQMAGGAWIMSGQMIFNPDSNATGVLRHGSVNMRTADGYNFNVNPGICMRINASWTPDWVNRNDVSTPSTPTVTKLVEQFGSALPLPPVAIARGYGGASVTGFIAFRDGRVAIAGTGNDGFTFGANERIILQLPAGKVPTAMAVTNTNEFVLVTVWDVNELRGQVAVIAVDNPLITEQTRSFAGFPGWPTVTGMKLLGFIDLPFAAPMAIEATVSTRLGNPRGNNDLRNENFNDQATRNRWFNVPYLTDFGPDYWRQTPQSGYAVVSSRAENKVAIIDLRPMFRYFREMNFTTAARRTQVDATGPGANQWPHQFSFAPQSRPTIAKVLDIQQPTAVATGTRWNTNLIPRSFSQGNNDVTRPLRTVYIARMDGTVGLYDVSSLIDPTATANVPATPFRTLTAGRNPTRIFRAFHATSGDDIFIVSRGDRTVIHAEFDGDIRATLRDSRLVDPVNITVSFNQAGFGGLGFPNTTYAPVMTVLDYDGKRVHSYLVEDGINVGGELWPIRDANGSPIPFLYGSGTPVPGKPFQNNYDEVI